MSRLIACSLLLLLGSSVVFAAAPTKYLTKPDDWFATVEAKGIADAILSYQSPHGGWPKNTDTTKPYTGDKNKLKPTFDNGATTDELRFLARMVNATKTAEYRTAFDAGLGYVLSAQYPNGGWPQYAPPPEKSYHRHITFNDNAMVRLMEFVHEVASQDRYRFVSDAERKRCRAAFDQGVECILKCQITVNGKLTVWCAQHDAITLKPETARSYELSSLSGAESVGLTRLLMSLENPSPQVVKAVEAATAWFASSKLTGIRVDVVPDTTAPKGMNKVVVADPKAPPLWARFYDLETGKPIFVGRDGGKKATIAEIESERRNGYAWYGTWPQKLLDTELPAWRRRVHADPRKPKTDDDMKFWLRTAVAHQYTPTEIGDVVGLTTDDVKRELKRLNIDPAERTMRKADDPLTVLPYPGGRHPRAGFLDGAIKPQRETKASVFAPWADGGYVVADVPEAVWFNTDGKRELLYLAHTHIPTVWDKGGAKLVALEWERGESGKMTLTRTLPNKVALGMTLSPGRDGVRFEFRVTNGTDKKLTGLSAQMCVMLNGLTGFTATTNDNKVFAPPFAACRDATGKRWVIVGWEGCGRAWGNPPCPCLHADPILPDCLPGESRTARGWVSFFEGDDVRTELKRLASVAFEPMK